MKIKQLLLAAAAMVFAVACNEVPDEPVKPTPEVQIGVMPMEVSYVAAGGEQTVSVVAKGAWTATPDAEWIKVEPASGEAGTVSVKIYAEKNATTEAREGKVVFAVGEEKAEVAVAQQAGEPAGSDVWGIAGSHQGDTADTKWKPENAPEMGFADGYYYQKGMELKAGHEFKFVKDKAWAVNRGYSGGKPMTANYFYAVEHNGQNIKILADGTYDVYLNEEATVFYLMEAGKLPAEAKDSSELAEAEVPEADKGWRVVGTHNEWKEKDGTDYTMTLEDGLYGYKGLEFTAAGEFKFVQDRNWSKTVGVDNDAELAVNCFYAAGGSNIKVAAGTYDLYLSEDATKFYVMEAGVAPSEAKDGAAGAGPVLPEMVEFTATEIMVSTWTDDLNGITDTTVKFVGEEYEVIVVLDTDNILELPDEDLGFTFDNGINSAKIQSAESGELIAEFVSGSFSAGEMFDGGYYVSGEFTTESGATVYVGYDGPIEGLGGGDADAIEFVVAEGKLSQDPDQYGPTVWILELKSANNEVVTAFIDIMVEQNFLGTGYWPVGMQGMSRMPYVIAGPSKYINYTTLVEYMLYPSADGMLTMESGYDGTEQGSDVNIIGGSLGLFDEMNYVEAGTIKFSTPTPIALYGDAGEGGEGGETEENKVFEFYINPEAGMMGESVEPMNFMSQAGCPAYWLTLNAANGDQMCMILFDYDYQQAGCTDFTYLTAHHYPIVGGYDMPEVSCLWNEPSMSCFTFNDEYWYPIVPESETDAEGMPYGVTIYWTGMPDADIVVMDFNIPVEDDYGNVAVVKGGISCALGYTGGAVKQEIPFNLNDFGFTEFNATIEGTVATLVSSNSNGKLTIKLDSWGENPYASEDGIVYYSGDNLEATFVMYDMFEDIEYNAAEGGRVMVCTTAEANVFELIFTSHAPLKLEGDNNVYVVDAEDTYMITVNGF